MIIFLFFAASLHPDPILLFLPITSLIYKFYPQKYQKCLLLSPMITRFIKNKTFRTLSVRAANSFCRNRDYFENKRLRQIEKTKTSFKHDQSKLKQLNINLKSLSPNFFTKTLPMKESEKIIMPNREANAIDNSFISLQIPLSRDQEIKNTLVRLTSNQVRIGRILQCMDSIAGIVGYRHCFGSLTNENPFVLVTGSVDSINLFQPIYIDKDIIMEGYVNYVGRTSMEIQINLFQNSILKSNALFTMISRNSQNHSKSYPCPALRIQQLPEPQRTKAEARKNQGQLNSLRRKKQMAQSYHLKPPTSEDAAIIHNIFLNSTERAKESIDTEKTIITNIRLMHMQQRNIHNKIFGGFLMREMVETGWVVASRFANSQELHIEDITNVYFKEPVEIGCHLIVTGRVSYTKGNILIVTMQSSTYTFGQDPQQKKCCQLQMFFKCKKDQKKVFPKTYENGIYYLTSRNEFKHAFPTVKE